VDGRNKAQKTQDGVDAPAFGVRVLLQHRFSLDPDAGEGDQSKAVAQESGGETARSPHAGATFMCWDGFDPCPQSSHTGRETGERIQVSEENERLSEKWR